jgi:nicotinamide mononucleotide (NMN) deamidase PncC
VLSQAEGAGQILHGGFVTYTKANKTMALGVDAKLLETSGSVNEELRGSWRWAHWNTRRPTLR